MDNTAIDNGEHITELEKEAERLYPINSTMCKWRREKALWQREKWIKEQLSNLILK